MSLLRLICNFILLGSAALPGLAFAQATSTVTQTSTPAAPVGIIGLDDLDDLPDELPEESSDRPKVAGVSEVIDEVVVTGSRVKKKLKDTTVTTELLNRREIRDSGAEDLNELLEEHQGVEIERSTRGSGVRLMGLDPEHTLVLIDGERVTGRVGGSIDLTRYNLENVEQVEIVKGAGSAIYGSEAVGGVINIITKEAKAPLEAQVKSSYGTFDTLDVTGNAGGRVGILSTSFSGGYHRSDGFTITDCSKVFTRPCDPEVGNIQTLGSAYESWNLTNTTNLRLTPKADLKARFTYAFLDQNAMDQNGPTERSVSLRRQTQETWDASLSPNVQLENGRFKGHVKLSRYDFDIDQQAESSHDRLYQTVGHVLLQVDQLVLDRHLISVGLEGILEQQGGTTESRGGKGDFLDGGDQERQRAAAYVQDEWSPVEDPFLLSIVPSVRVDVDSQFGSVLTPRFALRYDPIKQLALRLSYGLGFRAPTFEELYLSFQNPASGYFIDGNPDLKPERSQAFNATATLEPLRWISLTGTFYYINLENLIQTERQDEQVGGLNRFQANNVESARSTGAESQIELRFDYLSLAVGYVFNATKDRSLDRPLEGRARHKGTVRATFRHPGWGLRAMLRSQIYGERPFFRDLDGDGEEDRLPLDPYATIDFRAEFAPFQPFDLDDSFLDNLAFFAGFENLLNAGDAEFTPIRPRSFYGGVFARYALEPAPGGAR